MIQNFLQGVVQMMTRLCELYYTACPPPEYQSNYEVSELATPLEKRIYILCDPLSYAYKNHIIVRSIS
jgi:alcohol dehydrogenase YqhD (iron-dependent ADH family)